MPESLAAPLALAALVLAAIALVLVVVVVLRDRSRPAPRPLPALLDADALEAYLREQLSRLEEAETAVAGLGGRAAALETGGQRAVQRVGLVRFNPFEDTGSNQSFALALLDGVGNGIVLSSLHSRQATRLYVKEMVGGRSESALSDEETEALRRAGLTP